MTLHIGRFHFTSSGRGVYRAELPDVDERNKGACKILVRFDASSFPLVRYYRYARFRNPHGPWTFSQLDFSDVPPGVLAGPWPGWRTIPGLPRISARIGEEDCEGTFVFWGDELQQTCIRAVFQFTLRGKEDIVLDGTSGLVPVEGDVYTSHILRAEPMPVNLRPELEKRYPRLLFDAGFVSVLKRRAQTSHHHIWQRVCSLYDLRDVPARKTPESKTVEGPERLFPEDRLLITALLHLLQHEKVSRADAVRAFEDYLDLADDLRYEPLQIDTQCGEVLFTMCLAYDWLHNYLTPAQRDRARDRLFEVADHCWRHLGYERRDFVQAHFLGCGLGILAFAFLFWDEHPRSREWASYLRGVMEVVIGMLPEDGFFPHGINLWIYEHGFLFRWLELFRHAAGEDFWGRSQYWRCASGFRAAATSPDGLYGITFGDPQYRVGGDAWCHYLVATRTGSGSARWIGDALSDAPHEGVDYRNIPPRRRVYELMYFDPEIPPQQPDGVLNTFHDGGQVFVRSRKDGKGFLFTFRSGPPLGKKRYEEGVHGAYGHSDPANGAFLLYSDNAFIASGPGPVYRRDTSLHNTVTIDGKGQLGDGCVWLPDFFPPENLADLPTVSTDDTFVSMSVELSRNYLPFLGVQSCRRSIGVEPGEFIIGFDEVRLDTPRTIQWNFHSWEDIQRLDREPLVFKIGRSPRGVLHMLGNDEYSWRIGRTQSVPAYPHDGRVDTSLQVSRNGDHVRFTWVLALREGIEPRASVRADGSMEVEISRDWVLRFDGKTVKYT